MLINLFKASGFLLLLLLLCFTVYEHARANGVASSLSGSDNVVLFQQNEEINDALGPSAAEQDKQTDPITVTSYYSPSLVATENMMIAVVGVNRTDNSKENVDILTKYIEMNEGWSEKDFTRTDSKCKKQFAVNKNVGNLNVETYVVKSLLVGAKQNKVYLLLVNYTNSSGLTKTSDLEFKLVVGEMNKGKKAIVWVGDESTVVSVTEEFKKKFIGHQLTSDFFSGSTFLTKDGKVVFALVVNNIGLNMAALLELNNDEKTLNFAYPEIAEYCYPYYFPWGEKIIMVPVHCLGDNTNKKIMASSNIGAKWEVSKETFFQYYDFFQSKQNFVSIKNGTKEILLFTEHKPEPFGQPPKKINLWMSDGIRFKDIGEIATAGDTITPIRFLFAKEKFFLLNQELGGRSKEIETVKLKYLRDQSTKLMSTINAWENTDAKISTLCSGQDVLKIPCWTDGLLGFLSGNKETNEWKDEYLYVNANIKGGATKVESGFTFTGKGVGAKWPVGEKQPEDQPYNFTDPGFTLVAAVEINGIEENVDNSLLGVVLNGEKKPVQLWCSKDKWAVGGRGKTIVDKNDKKCEQGKTYVVALVLNKDGNVLVYVDWEQMTDLNGGQMKIEKTDTIKYFYFGAGSDTLTSAKTDVTVTNVLLYNRPFGTSEISKFKRIAEEQIAQLRAEKNKDDKKAQNVEKNTSETDRTSSTSATEKDEAVIKLCLFSMNCVLLSFFFNAFTLLGRYVRINYNLYIFKF